GTEVLGKDKKLGGAPVSLGDGNLFVGETGLIIADYEHHRLLRDNTVADYKAPAPTIPDSVGHHKEGIAACRTGAATTCNFDYSGALTEAVLLGNVSYRLGKKIEWDAPGLRSTNVPE